MNPQYLQAGAAIIAAYAALFGGIYAAITRPLLLATKSAVDASEARLKLQLTELKLQLTEMEARLNQRIADKLNDHGERITRLEERKFR